MPLIKGRLGVTMPEGLRDQTRWLLLGSPPRPWIMVKAEGVHEEGLEEVFSPFSN